MPYTDVTHPNGFTERIYTNMTASEEAERFNRMSGVKSFPSTNHRAATRRAALKSSIWKDQEPLEPLQEE
jgi:hypothetical protein